MGWTTSCTLCSVLAGSRLNNILLRHAAAADGAEGPSLRVAVADGEEVTAPPEEMELPLTTILLRHPKDDTSRISLSVGSLVEKDGHFTVTLPHIPSAESTFEHIAVFGYVLNYEMF